MKNERTVSYNMLLDKYVDVAFLYFVWALVYLCMDNRDSKTQRKEMKEHDWKVYTEQDYEPYYIRWECTKCERMIGGYKCTALEALEELIRKKSGREDSITVPARYLNPHNAYEVSFDDCCIKGDFTSVFISGNNDKYSPETKWSNGITLLGSTIFIPHDMNEIRYCPEEE